MKEVFVRIDRCVGCGTCELACAVEHSTSKDIFAAIQEKPLPRKRIYLESVAHRPVPLVCRHCEDAPCVKVCRTSALNQDPFTHVVTHIAGNCIGCWMCTMACPYGMIGREHERRVAVKCDRCPEREVPACVESCPTGAITYMDAADYADIRRRQTAADIAKYG